MSKSILGLFTFDHVHKIIKSAVAYSGCVLLKDIGDIPAGTDLESVGLDFSSSAPVMCFSYDGKKYFVTLSCDIERVDLEHDLTGSVNTRLEPEERRISVVYRKSASTI